METTISSVLTEHELLGYIEFLRSDLIDIGLTYGFNNHRTIKASQELDYFIFEYQKLTRALGN